MNKKNFVIIMTMIFSLNIWAQRTYVNSAEDFYIHTKNHVNNTNAIAEQVFEAIRKDPEKWGPVFKLDPKVKVDNKLKKLVMDYMARHDEAKLNTNAKFYTLHGRPRPVILELYDQFGKRAPDEVVGLVNSVDRKVGIAFYRINHISETDWRRAFLEEIEHFSDGIERGENPVTPEEMGRAAYKESGSTKYKIHNVYPPATKGNHSKMYSALKEAGVSSGLADDSRLPIHKEAMQVTRERDALLRRAELAEMFEKKYSSIAVHYNTAKDRYTKLFSHLKEAGIVSDNLDPLARFELIDAYERKYGLIKDIGDKKLVEKFNNFFFHTPEGQKKLVERIPPSLKSKGLAMLEQGKKKLAKTVLGLIDCQNHFSAITQ